MNIIEKKVRDLRRTYVDACCMCTKLGCDDCQLNMFIEDLEEIIELSGKRCFMTFDEVFQEPSNRQKILDFIDEIKSEHPYKVYGQAENSQYNEAWCDALDRVRCFVENM